MHQMVFTNQTKSQLLHVTVAIKKSKVGKQELVRVVEIGMDRFENAKKVIYNFINIFEAAFKMQINCYLFLTKYLSVFNK